MVVESYVIIEKIIEDSCEQTMEFALKIEKDKPFKKDLPLFKNEGFPKCRYNTRCTFNLFFSFALYTGDRNIRCTCTGEAIN